MYAPTSTAEAIKNRCSHTATRYDMLESQWLDHAETRVAEFFAAEVGATLPPAETAYNLFLSIVLQICTLYDTEGVVEARGADHEEIAAVVSQTWWAQQQQTLEYTFGLNDCFVQVCWTQDRGIFYEIVPPHWCAGPDEDTDVVPDPRAPDQPIAISRMEHSENPTTGVAEYTYTIRDLRPTLKGEPPIFRVEVEDDEGNRRDRTEDYYPPGTIENGWPKSETARDGTPVMTLIAYHRRVWSRVLTPMRGSEMVSAALTVAALITSWEGGFRDGAHPQRYVMDVEVKNQTTGLQHQTGGKTSGPNPPIKSIKMDRTSILQLRSSGDRPGVASQFNPVMDPKPALEAVVAFAAQAAIYTGVNADDISVGGGSAGQSGYAVSIKRSGQQRARKRLKPSMRAGDLRTLSTAAKISNANQSTNLPEEMGDWMIRYADLPKSLEEIRAELAEADSLRQHGLINRVDHFLRFHPGLSREQAIEKIVSNSMEEATIEKAISGIRGNMPDTGKRFLIGDKTTAQDIVGQYESGELSGPAASALLTTMIGLTSDEATSLLSGEQRTPDE